MDGNELLFERPEDTNLEEFRWYLLGRAFNYVLHQRGLLVLHASVVQIENIAVGFLGVSGQGKSTTSATFLREGHRVLAEDVAVTEGRNAPEIRPAFPAIKLTSEIRTELDVPVETIPENDSDLPRHFYRIPGNAPTDPIPLSRLYILAPEEEYGTPTTESIAGEQGVVELVRYTHPIDKLEETATSGRNLKQCGNVARNVPIRRLRYAWDIERLPEIVDTVQEDVR